MKLTNKMIEQQVILVDSKDQQIGVAEKLAAHQQGLLHRAFSVFIYRYHNNLYEILLQKRHTHKYHSAGLWTNTCCSHPAPREDVRDAAARRLQEEMGIKAVLKEIGVFHYTAQVGNGLIENEIDHVFIGEMPAQEIKIDQEEVADFAWVEVKKLQAELQQYPERYTAWFGQALEIFIINMKI